MKLSKEISLEDFKRVVLEKEEITLSDEDMNAVKISNKILNEKSQSTSAFYGINTGFGHLANTRIPPDDIDRLQEHLILSHSSGVGSDLPVEIVRGAMLLRLLCLLKGYSGVRPEILKMLLEMLNRDLIPAVPEKGSVGASGDLAPSAHLALVLLGRGYAYHDGEKISGNEGLSRIGLNPIKLKTKEGLSLINGTQFMTSIAAFSMIKTLKLLDYSDHIAAMSIESAGGRMEPFDPELHELRPYRGQKSSAELILSLLDDSQIKRASRVQDPYSFRCIPQVHGAIRDTIEYCRKNIEIEMNSVTDNPLIVENKILSGGNFHGEPVAFTMDFSKIALTELSSISERRIAHLMDSEITGLERFLVKNPGLNSGYMIPHTVASSLVSRNKDLSVPSSTDTVPTSLNQEDHVSMGMNSGISLLEILDNTFSVLSIEILVSLQALRMKGIHKISDKLKKFVEPVEEIIDEYGPDREHSEDIEKVKYLMWKNKL